MERIYTIKSIMDTITDEIVISSCGKISREVFEVKDRPLNFYVQGSMGCALPVAIGVALCKPDRKIVAVIGDGEALMGLDSLVLLKKLQEMYVAKGLEVAMPFIKKGNERKTNSVITENKFNLDLYVLDNNKYQSTGGQKTISDVIDFRLLCDCKVIFCEDSETESPRISISHEQIKKRFMHAIR